MFYASVWCLSYIWYSILRETDGFFFVDPKQFVNLGHTVGESSLLYLESMGYSGSHVSSKDPLSRVDYLAVVFLQ